MPQPNGAGPGDDALWAWAGRAAGGTVVRHERLVSGNSRTTWAVDVATSETTVPLVLRTDSGEGPFSGTPLTLAREASVYMALHGRGIRIPRPYGFDPELRALALARAAGDDAWDEQVLDALLAELAELHTLEPATVDLPGFEPRAAADLELWAEVARCRVDPPSETVELAFELLRAHFPGEPERLVVVHGDPGPGNVLWHEGDISALLDWEMTHFGDPHDDLAFLTVRAGLFGAPLPDFAARVRRSYAPHAGVVLDERRLRYWQVVGVLRNLVTCLAAVSNPVQGRDRLVHHMLIPSLDRLLLGGLAELEGVVLDDPPPPVQPQRLPAGEVLAEIARDLGGLVPAIADPEPRQRARRMRHLLGQLAETWPLAAEIARADAAEPPASSTAGRLRRLGRIADRRLQLFPRARALAGLRLPGLD